VLLVPGRNADSVALVDLQRRLFLTGRRVIIVSTGIEDTGDLRAQARQVQETAENMIATGAPSVDVVGYSAGGIVTRLWLAQGGEALARRVVTIASPNHGVTGAPLNSLVTKKYCEVTCPQLTRDSDLLNGLPEVKGKAPWLNLWSTQDHVVAESTAKLPGVLNVPVQSVCPKNKSGHVSMPSDPAVVGIVLKALALAPVTTAPTRRDCAGLRKNGSEDNLPGATASP
jgi:triacylglycerol lipase